MGELWANYSPEELETIIDFIHRSNEIVAEENATLRTKASSLLDLQD
jgi:hypothetical protein